MFNWPGRRTYSHYGQCFAHEVLSVGSVPVGFTSSIYFPAGENPAGLATVSIEGEAVRFREDGGDPDSNTGHALFDGDVCVFRGIENIQKARFISPNGTVTLQVSYYR